MANESIEVKGIRFTAEEVKWVKIEREGTEISIDVKHPPKPIGFQQQDTSD